MYVNVYTNECVLVLVNVCKYVWEFMCDCMRENTLFVSGCVKVNMCICVKVCSYCLLSI